MKAVLLPLDERPCNAQFPKLVTRTSDLELLIPEKKRLGDKKKPALFENIKDYLLRHTQVDAMVISIDMLLYGGLLPSRIHHLNKEKLQKRLELLKQLKEKNPQLKIYGFLCIMRCPSYNSSEEEPDYYEKYGFDLFQYGVYKDKQARHCLSEEENKKSFFHIPQEIITDYEHRRHVNVQMNQLVLSYLESGILDFLVIPQDDSSPYGYTAMDQHQVLSTIKEKHLMTKCMVYPGADEVSMSLLTRAYNEYHHKHPKIYSFYSSTLGPTIIPKYEDRPMFETLKSHLLVTGARLVRQYNQADLILAINAPGKFMQESFDDIKDVTYDSFRNLSCFVEEIKEFMEEGYPVALCDSAFSNGGDIDLIKRLDDENCLDQLKAYAGWNTNANTLGTVIAQSLINSHNDPYHLIYRLLEDVFYQSKVRKYVIDNILLEKGLGYYDFKDQQDTVEDCICQLLLKEYAQLQLSSKYSISSLTITMPWHRMFEIGMELTL